MHALQDYYAHGNFYPIEQKYNSITYKTTLSIRVHSKEYDNPYYDWKNKNKNSFKKQRATLGTRYEDTRKQTKKYIKRFIKLSGCNLK